MPYTPDAEDVNAPLITEIAKTAAAEFRTIKAYMQTLKDVPRDDAAFGRGKCRVTAASVTINTSDLFTGKTMSIYNNSDANITLVQGTGVTLRLSGTTTTGNRTLGPRALVTLWCPSGTEVVAIGAGLS